MNMCRLLIEEQDFFHCKVSLKIVFFVVVVVGAVSLASDVMVITSLFSYARYIRVGWLLLLYKTTPQSKTELFCVNRRSEGEYKGKRV